MGALLATPTTAAGVGPAGSAGARLTIPALLAAAVARHATATALIAAGHAGEERWRYTDLWHQSGQAAAVLRALGVAPGDRVLLWAANHPRWVIAFVGLARLGAVAVPLDAGSDPNSVAVIAARTGARLALIDAAAAARYPTGGPPALRLDELAAWPARPPAPADLPAVRPDDLAAVLFTSGSTGQPKGVMLSHANLTSNALAVAVWLPPRPDDRALSLLPLSHALELTVGTLLPLSGGACIVYPPSRAAADVFACLARYRITALVAVPAILRLFHDALAREAERRLGVRPWRLLNALAGHVPPALRRLLFRPVHRRLGGRLRLLVSGGAPLDPALARRWERLGVPVVQGYGLSEAGPVCTGTTVAGRRPGSVGRCLPGQELRLDGRGEILVRGPNVMRGYWDDPAATRAALVDGWLHTGDLGRLDRDGYLYLTGRAKDLIVLSSGLNVHAGDVEAALAAQPGVRAAAVLERPDAAGAPQVFAVLAGPADEAAAAAAVRAANQRLAPHQRVRGWAVWPEADLPRTASLKVKKHELAAWLDRRPRPVAAAATIDAPVARVVALVAQTPSGTITPAARLGDDLGLDSLGLVELLAALESELGLTVDEQRVTPATTVAELIELAAAGALPDTHLPAWPRAGWCRALREGLQWALLCPLLRGWCRLEVRGREHLAGLSGPVIVTPNHASHVDTPAVLAALPPDRRRRVAVGAAADYFFVQPALGMLVGLLFNAFPFERRGAASATLRTCRRLTAEGWSLLLYPEGTRSPNGRLGAFRPGVGLLASELGWPVVPVRLTGTDRVLPKGARWPRPGRVTVTFGAPLVIGSDCTAAEAARRIEAAVRALGEEEV